MADYVFGYGSLVRRSGSPCSLWGFRRHWGVAMDNRHTIPGYKYYVDARTGARPRVFVAFLDVRPSDDGATNGLVFRVSAEELTVLDERERNYERVEVTGAIDPAPRDGRVWTYTGSADARRRHEHGLGGGNLVVSAEYARLVVAGFEALGRDAAARYRESTDEPPCPVADLRRIDVPS